VSHLEKALWIQPSHRLRWAIFLSSTTVSCTFAQSFHREAFGLVVTVARQYPSLVSMAFCYSISQLRRLKPAITPGLNIPIINELGLLRRPRYIHRDSGRKLIFQPQPSCSATNIPSLWSLIARLKRHQIAVAPSAMNSGNTARSRRIGLDGIHGGDSSLRGVDFSVLRPIQRFIPHSWVKIELFNTQSMSNKPTLIEEGRKDWTFLSPRLQLPGGSMQHWLWWWPSSHPPTGPEAVPHPAAHNNIL